MSNVVMSIRSATIGFLVAPIFPFIARLLEGLISQGQPPLLDFLFFGTLFYLFAFICSFPFSFAAFLLLNRFGVMTWPACTLGGLLIAFFIASFVNRPVMDASFDTASLSLSGAVAGYVFWIIATAKNDDRMMKIGRNREHLRE